MKALFLRRSYLSEIALIISAILAGTYILIPSPGIIISISLSLLLILTLIVGWKRPEAFFYSGFAIALFNGFMNKYFDFPYGIIVDMVMILGLLIIFLRGGEVTISKVNFKSIDFIILIWVFYTLIQAFNPELKNIWSWAYSVRTMSLFTGYYFISRYSFISGSSIKRLINFTIVLSLLAALYGIYQYLFGLSQVEKDWLEYNPTAMQLFLHAGKIRPFSFFSDPTTFGIYMALVGTICGFKVLSKTSIKTKSIAFFVAVIFIICVFISGSRTAMILIPFAVGLLILFKLNVKLILAGMMGFVITLGIIFSPLNHPLLNRFRTAFQIEGPDASMSIRDENRIYIQPQILAHPFGQGLGTTGFWGSRFSPDSHLANFVHDSGYLRIAVELGWVGLLLFLSLLFIILRRGIYLYVYTQDTRIRNQYLCALLLMLQLALSHLTQETFIQYPINFIFITSLILLNISGKTFNQRNHQL